MRRLACLLAAAALLLGAGAARASDPIGAYVAVEKVVLAPNSDSPASIQVWGTFALLDPEDGRAYQPPRRGYVYYTVTPGKEKLCRAEWADLKKAAGTGEVIAFGSRLYKGRHMDALGYVRRPDEKPRGPTPYPLNAGLVKIRPTATYSPVIDVRSYPTAVSPPAVAGSSVTLTARHHPDEKVSYHFELTGPGGVKETSPAVSGKGPEASWKPRTALKAGAKYTWRVWASAGKWKGPAVTSAFTVKGDT